MKTTFQTIAWSALGAFLCISPFAAMEIFNRRAYGEDFPFMLFFAMWINFFAILAILLPLGWGIWRAKRAQGQPAPAAGNPRRSIIFSLSLLGIIGLLSLLDALGWLPLTAWFNGPNPQEFYPPGWIINLVFFGLPLASGLIASQQIVRTRAAGGRWFAHPVLWLIVIVLVVLFASGLLGLILNQWPCFIGRPVCD